MSPRPRLALAAVTLLLAAVASVPAAPPGEKPPAATVVPPNAPIVVSLDFARLWNHRAFGPVRDAPGKAEFAWVVQSLLGLPPAEIARVTAFWTRGENGPAGPFLLVTGRKPVDAKQVAAGMTRKGATPLPKPADPRVLTAAGAEFPYLVVINDRTLLLGPAGTDAKQLVALADQPRAGNGLFDAALGKSALVVGLDPSIVAELPLPVGAPLLEAKTAVLTADPTGDKKGRAVLTLTFATPEQAKKAAPILRAKLDELAGWTAARQKQEAAKPTEGMGLPAPLLEWLTATLKAAKVAADGASLTATADIDLDDTVYRAMLAAPDSVFSPRGTSAAENNLKQIGLAWHSYHDTMGAFPSNTYTKDGKPLLSWRVQILPYIEQNALYNQFKLDEPWDSPHNKPLGETLVKVFMVPGRPAPALNETYFRTFILPKDAKPADGRPLLTEGDLRGPKIASVTDGLSNTFMVVEAGEAVPWTKPDDLPYDGVLPLPTLGGPSGRFSVLFGDGSVRTFRSGQIDETNMRRLITRDDGQVVNIPDR